MQADDMLTYETLIRSHQLTGAARDDLAWPWMSSFYSDSKQLYRLRLSVRTTEIDQNTTKTIFFSCSSKHTFWPRMWQYIHVGSITYRMAHRNWGPCVWLSTSSKRITNFHDFWHTSTYLLTLYSSNFQDKMALSGDKDNIPVFTCSVKREHCIRMPTSMKHLQQLAQFLHTSTPCC